MSHRLTRRLSRPLGAAVALALALPVAAFAGDRDDDGRRSAGDLTFATVKDGATLVVFDRAGSRSVPISGLAAGERVVGIDVRPRNPTQLYGIGSTSQVYVIDATSGTATKVGAGFAAGGGALEGTAFGVDFNPAADRIRIVSDTGQNLRVHPDTGALAGVDQRLKYAATDRNAGAPPAGVGAGYTFAPFVAPPAAPSATTLYDVEANRDTLVTQAPPNDGTLNSVGRLGVDAGAQVGFDIAGTSEFRGFGLVQQGDRATLHRVSLSSGRAWPTRVTLAGSYDGLAVLDGYENR